jgi:hypothetical protein
MLPFTGINALKPKPLHGTLLPGPVLESHGVAVKDSR